MLSDSVLSYNRAYFIFPCIILCKQSEWTNSCTSTCPAYSIVVVETDCLNRDSKQQVVVLNGGVFRILGNKCKQNTDVYFSQVSPGVSCQSFVTALLWGPSQIYKHQTLPTWVKMTSTIPPFYEPGLSGVNVTFVYLNAMRKHVPV